MLAQPAPTDEHGEHVVPLKVYFGVAGALFFLTALTLGMSFVDLGPMNMLVAMLIAGIKASLVALIFMHLLWDNKFLMAIFLTALVFLAIFIGLTLADTMRRGDIYQESGRPITPQSEMYNTQGQNGAGGQTQEAGVIPSNTYTSGTDSTKADTATSGVSTAGQDSMSDSSGEQ